MSIISIILICLCIGVESFWTGFYLKSRKVNFSLFAIVLAYLACLLICMPFLHLGRVLSQTSTPRLLDAIVGLVFGVVGALSLTQNIKRKDDPSLKHALKYHTYNRSDIDFKNSIIFFTGSISYFCVLLSCLAFGISNMASAFIGVFMSLILILSMLLGFFTSNKSFVSLANSILKYLPGCILLFLGVSKFF